MVRSYFSELLSSCLGTKISDQHFRRAEPAGCMLHTELLRKLVPGYRCSALKDITLNSLDKSGPSCRISQILAMLLMTFRQASCSPEGQLMPLKPQMVVGKIAFGPLKSLSPFHHVSPPKEKMFQVSPARTTRNFWGNPATANSAHGNDAARARQWKWFKAIRTIPCHFLAIKRSSHRLPLCTAQAQTCWVGTLLSHLISTR